MKQCPECGKRHRTFPEKCFFKVQNTYALSVISEVASGSNFNLSEFDKEVRQEMRVMEEYVKKFLDQ